VSTPDREATDAAYLSAAVAWIRALLAQHVEPESAAAAGDPDELRIRMDALATGSPAPSAVELFERFQLSDFERNVLLLCVAAELASDVAALLARAGGERAVALPTFAVAMTILPSPAWEALSPGGKLRYWRMVEVDHRPEPLTSRALRLDERILHQVKGLAHLDERLAPTIRPGADLGPHELPASQRAVCDAVVATLDAATSQGPLPLIQLVGPASSARLVAHEVCSELALTLAEVAAGRLPRGALDLAETARLWSRELRLGPVALLVSDLDDLDEHERSGVRGVLDLLWGPVFLSSCEAAAGASDWALAFDVARPTAAEQMEAWTQAAVGAADAEALAGHFDLEQCEIERVALVAGARGDGTGEALWDACRRAARRGLDQLAQRVQVKARWSDLVLPRHELDLLEMVVNHASNRLMVYDSWGYGARMNRGFGVAALFAGGSGTGKSMAAEAIAGRLRLDLYRIDLAALVSKWVGETAKSLRRVFDAAERSGAVLFFDEADAVFGKRTEIRDAHDRYANTETDYLLQRLESYRGVAILATNKRSSIDAAFVRRLRVVVTFPAPGVDERRRLWETALPAAVPRDPQDPIDADRLAGFELSGGSIHAAGLTGSFLAASDGGAVGMRHLVAGARNELVKLERPADQQKVPVGR
jgi:hypothetical protein